MATPKIIRITKEQRQLAEKMVHQRHDEAIRTIERASVIQINDRDVQLRKEIGYTEDLKKEEQKIRARYATLERELHAEMDKELEQYNKTVHRYRERRTMLESQVHRDVALLKQKAAEALQTAMDRIWMEQLPEELIAVVDSLPRAEELTSKALADSVRKALTMGPTETCSHCGRPKDLEHDTRCPSGQKQD